MYLWHKYYLSKEDSHAIELSVCLKRIPTLKLVYAISQKLMKNFHIAKT